MTRIATARTLTFSLVCVSGALPQRLALSSHMALESWQQFTPRCSWVRPHLACWPSSNPLALYWERPPPLG